MGGAEAGALQLESKVMATLVIGDGNFSYSLALAQHRDLRTAPLVCTCLEGELELAKRPLAVECVTELRKLGVCVLYGVDGTKLEACPQLAALGKKYSTIVFNFPHSGGKSNIKRNRQLLRDFFKSSVSILLPDGEVHVTLCRGQGGTPADATARGHHNSWQVVEMAAEAGLLLGRVEPFTPSSCPGYVPTGYRGKEKGFMLSGALLHVFRLPQMEGGVGFWIPHKGGGVALCQHCSPEVTGCDPRQWVQSCLPGLEEMVARPVLLQPWHPITSMHRTLLRTLQLESSLWSTVHSEVRECCVIHRFPSQCCPDSCTSAVSHEAAASEGVTFRGSANPPVEFVFQFTSDQLLPSILSRCSNCAAPGALYTVCCPVVKQMLVSTQPVSQPISHELCCVLPPREEAGEGAQLAALGQILLDTLKVALGHSPSTTRFSEDKSSTVEVTVSGGTFPVAWFGALSPPSGLGDRGGWPSLITFTISLDTLALAHYNIPDVRLLWSRDKHFISQFCNREASEGFLYQPTSLFHPHYTHDISFWVEPSADEPRLARRMGLELGRVVRMVAPSSVARVLHLETYCPTPGAAGGGRVGLCYRLEYSSPDGALSRSSVAQLQLRVREAMAEEGGVVLR